MKKLFATLAALAVLPLAGLFATAQPAAAAASCAGPGYLCFLDYETWQYGNVSGNNLNWTDFGWNDRADWFRNDGTQCNVRIYQHKDYAGAFRTLPRGGVDRWYDIVSSNKWCVN